MRRTTARGLQQWKAEIGNIEGLRLATDIVERAVETRQPVPRP